MLMMLRALLMLNTALLFYIILGIGRIKHLNKTHYYRFEVSLPSEEGK